ncbi:MAG TPA: T9SS type A sorting domain-containing protein, partial [Flavisolibacter sp.]|nr:T9SS type A sorting domain-containing protein [Flavisolibacter sp.]
YCIYDANNVLVGCSTSGVFTNLPYGAYCIRIVNTCYDTTITRCFTETRPLPSVNSSLQLLSSNCTTVSFKANGSNLTSPNYCLYDAADNLLDCNTTGVFNNYPYGSYCIVVKDGCVDTSIRVCRTFAPPRGFTLSTSKSCTIGNAYVDVQFTNNNAPYLVQVYNPGDSLVYTTSTSANPHRMQLPALPAGKQYKVVGTDFCGNTDAAFITPNANIVTKQVTVRAKCPGSTWLNGAGDLLAACSSNHYAVTPKIIKKNGAAFVSNYSSVTSGTYTFADLEPAEYIIEYTQSTCNSKIYDTVTVPPYAYPSQGQSAIYQCDNNSFSLGADVQNGISPYTFQIIGSMPASPDITTAPQNSPVFNINTGTTYSLVRLRTMDACGNATLSDVSVLPLQNISVTASDSCFYRNITLSVDSIPNASYSWYWKTSPSDSILMAASSTYNLPFFTPEQSGRYVCKTVINGGCITRLSYFTLDGQCGMEVLPVNFQLQGKRTENTNLLSWTNTNQAGILKYVVERKRSQDREYSAISTIPVQNSSNYIFNDNSAGSGVTLYRLKLVHAGKIAYSNTVSIKWKTDRVHVYPNPVKDAVNISLTADAPTNYRIELVNSAGQLLYSSHLKHIRSKSFSYTRTSKFQPGIYLLRITNLDENTSDIHKLVFE